MPYAFKKAELPSGLTVIAEVDPAAHSAAVGYFVKTGARDEKPEVMGVSHFLEHMMFKGSAKRNAEEINRAFDRIGAKNNAFTSAEMTCFYATVLPEQLLGEGGANEIIADMMRPALAQNEFDTEKKVILEEIAMYRDNPFWVLFERAMEVYNGAREARPGKPEQDDLTGMHPLGHRVLGTDKTIANLTSQQMRAYFDNRYSSDNTIVALAGKVDFDRACDEIGRLCSAWKPTGADRLRTRPTYRDSSFSMHDEKVNRGYELMISPGPAMEDDRRYAAALLAQVLGGPDNSRLHWALIEPGIAEDAECAFDSRDGTGDFLVYAVGDPERLNEIRDIINREIDALDRTLTDDDLDKIRAKMATGVTLAGERPGGRMQRLGRQWTYLSRHTTLEEELERINRVTVNDLRGVLRDFGFKLRTTGRLTPPKT